MSATGWLPQKCRFDPSPGAFVEGATVRIRQFEMVVELACCTATDPSGLHDRAGRSEDSTDVGQRVRAVDPRDVQRRRPG